MWLYMFFLFAGIVLGLFNKVPKKVLEKSQAFQLWGLLLILFAMGVGIGADEETVSNFTAIGLQSVLLAAAAVAGSLVTVKMFRPVIDRKKEGAK